MKTFSYFLSFPVFLEDMKEDLTVKISQAVGIQSYFCCLYRLLPSEKSIGLDRVQV